MPVSKPAHSLARLILLLLGCALLLTPATGVAGQSEPTFHVVRPGETLSQIAEHYGLPVVTLMQLNGIDDPNAIRIGQALTLPTPPVNTPRAATPDIPPAVEVDPAYVSAAPPATHLVQPGETLDQIAEQYSLVLADLMQLNGLLDPNAVVAGQLLRLSPAVDTATAAPPATPATVHAPPTGQSPLQTIASLNQVYTIQPGDTLASVAVAHGVDEAALRRLNGVDPAVAILPTGATLVLPATPQELQVARALPVSAVREVVIQPGDSLGALAQANGLGLADLLEANHLDNPDTIYIGQRLTLPADPAAGSPQPPPEIGRPRTGYYYYTVKPGDTFSELARDFATTELAILEYNDLPDADTLYPDLQLRIPYGPPPLPGRLPPSPLSGTRFLVSLSRQQCWVLAGDQVLYRWPCSTGYGQWITRTGAFAVQTMQEMAQSSAYELDMPYWLGIYDVGPFENGIHGLPIRWDTGQKIWEGLIGQPATFGCAMLDDVDAATLYDLAYIGMPVYIVE